MKERNGVVDNSHISLGRATSLTGDPVDVARGQTTQFQHAEDSAFDLDAIPGLDPDAGVEGGVDPSKEDDNCAGGACKI